MKALFMTGQSNRHSCALSPIQVKVSQDLAKQGVNMVALNFPYNTELAKYRETNVLSASLSNSWQYLNSRTRAFSEQFRAAVINEFKGDTNYLVLAGSCGLEILNNLNLPNKILNKMQIYAYGPVARRLPSANITTVQGRSDWLSKLYFKQVDYQVDCGHMGYLHCQAVTDLLIDTVHRIQGCETGEAKKN